jgi:hypothetical protein
MKSQNGKRVVREGGEGEAGEREREGGRGGRRRGGETEEERGREILEGTAGSN